MRKTILLTIPVLAFTTSLASCRSPHQTEQAVLTKRVEMVAPDDVKRVRFPEFVKTYYVGRMPTKDGIGMHEAHRVYEIGSSSTWNLHPESRALAHQGPARGLVDYAYSPMPKDQRISAELNKQKAVTERIQDLEGRMQERVQAAALIEARGKMELRRIEDARTRAEQERQKIIRLREQYETNPPVAEQRKAPPSRQHPDTEKIDADNVGFDDQELLEWGTAVDGDGEGASPRSSPLAPS